MRKIVSDDRNCQAQLDDNGVLFHYDKVYVPTGDKKTEYCLTLRTTESTVRGESHKTYVIVENPAAKHYIIIKWPGMHGG
jgi:hypothetical protein